MPPSFAPPASPPPTLDLQAIQQRLEQQETELCQLREMLGTRQIVPPSLPSSPAGQMPAPATTGPQFGSILQTGAVMPAEASPALFQLQDKPVLATQASAEKASAESDAVKVYEVGSDLKMTASWRNGLQIQSANRDFRIHIGGVTQFDICMFNQDPGLGAPPALGGIGQQPDSLDLRRLRFRIDGTMYEVFEWFVQVDFDNLVTPAGSVNIQSPATTSPAFNECYIGWMQLPVVGNFRAGVLKEPIGFEHLQSDTLLPFMERSYLQDFIFGPFNGGYTPGLLAFNWTEDQNATWALGFFGANNDNFGFSLGNDYGVTGRLTWCPWYDEPTDGRYVMHFGVAGSVRAADEDRERLRVRGDIRSGPPGILNPIYADTGNLGASLQNIVAAEYALVAGSFSVVGEYAGTWIEDTTLGNTNVGTTFYQGGYIQCGYFLTGEHEVYNRQRATFDRVIPYENAFCVRTCDGHCKGWGAWQVCARYNTINLNDGAVNGGELNSFTFGVNWFWNPNARVQLNYDFTNRSSVTRTSAGVTHTVAAGDINALGIRFSYDY